MKDEIRLIMKREIDAIEKLITSMEKQHEFTAKNNVFGMEEVAAEIEICCKNIARIEIERRKITGGKPMSQIMKDIDDDEMTGDYRKIKKLLREAALQKDTNEILIRQGLGFSTRMLSMINPDRSIKTYNNYGKIGKK